MKCLRLSELRCGAPSRPQGARFELRNGGGYFEDTAPGGPKIVARTFSNTAMVMAVFGAVNATRAMEPLKSPRTPSLLKIVLTEVANELYCPFSAAAASRRCT